MPGTSRRPDAAAGSGPLAGLDRLNERADALAGAWGARARASTTLGTERAILRLLGVTGLSRAGRPLAGEVVDQYLAGHPERLGAGLILPFAMALLEYDLSPLDLALDVAAGTVDLALEADLLREPARRATAEVEAGRLAAAALERIDGDRTARGELIAVLGDAARPWIGTTLSEPVILDAEVEARRLVGAGFDLVRVDVPVGRELAVNLADAGLDVPTWHPRRRAAADPLEPRRPVRGTDEAPTGSQRGLARLRHVLDEIAAERRAYVRLATHGPALAAPEAAVVAASERVDLAVLDPMGEIVSGVDPDRALADHAFANRLLRRSGAFVELVAGPLVVAPDLATGVPSDAATRSGRSLALQLLAVRLAIADGLTPDRVLVGALPAWLGDEAQAAARAVAEVEIRRALLPDHALTFDEPAGDPQRGFEWPFTVAGSLPSGGATALLARRAEAGGGSRFARVTRAAASVGLDLAAARAGADLAGPAAEHARQAIAAALVTLDRVAGDGWRSILGASSGGQEIPRFGADAVAERTEAFDPFGT